MTEPAHLAFARSCIGRYTDPDAGVLAQRIAAIFPDEKPYCDLAGPTTSWCGIFVQFVLATAYKMRGPYGTKDTLRWMWADAWKDQPWGGVHVAHETLQPGDVLTFHFGTGSHVTLYVRTEGDSYVCIGGNQSNAVTETRFGIGSCTGRIRPAAVQALAIDVGSLPRPLIKLGATGDVVSEAQRLLGISVDGEFGPDMDNAVRSYQASRGLEVDGEIGPETWASLSAKAPAKIEAAASALPSDAVAKIIALAAASPLMSYPWVDRGRAPAGYIKGMAVAFGKVYLDLKARDPAAMAMAVAPGSAETDALAWYGFRPAAGPDALRALFSLMYGLGMRESSGNCYEGRDASATNTSADSAEAGLFQQSRDSFAASNLLPRLQMTWQTSRADGFLPIFREGLSGSPSPGWGDGDGYAFQQLCKNKPQFAVECAAIALRVLRKHWGPIIRREAEVNPDADALLRQVQAIVDAVPLEGEVIGPDDHKPPPPPPQQPGKDLSLVLIIIDKLLERHMASNPGTNLAPIRNFFRNPTIQKLFAGGAVTLDELLGLPGSILHDLADHAEGAPASPSSTSATTQTTAATTPASTSPIEKPSVQLSAIGLGLSSILQAIGTVGTPFGAGTQPTTTGTLATLIPIVTGIIGSTGAFGAAGSGIVKVIGGLFGALKK